MSTATPPPVRSPLVRWVRRLLVVFGVILLLLALMVGYVLNPFTAKARHRRMTNRLSEQVTAALEPLRTRGYSVDGLSLDERTRYEVLRAVNTAIANVLYYPQKCSPEKLRALVNRLNATGAAELQSDEGCLRLVAELEDICPDTHDYAWFVELRVLQEEGTVARLPARK